MQLRNIGGRLWWKFFRERRSRERARGEGRRGKEGDEEGRRGEEGRIERGREGKERRQQRLFRKEMIFP